MRISKGMNNYVYQIQGALEGPDKKFKGFRVLVCSVDNLEMVDVPNTIFGKETAKYIEFRLNVTTGNINIQSLPNVVQNRIRVPLGAWLDQWVLKNFYGNTSNTKRVNA